MFWDKWKEEKQQLEKDYEEVLNVNQELLKQLEELKKEKIPPKMEERVADLEIKLSKLWSMLIEYTPNNKEKLTKFGKRFGGKSGLN